MDAESPFIGSLAAMRVLVLCCFVGIVLGGCTKKVEEAANGDAGIPTETAAALPFQNVTAGVAYVGDEACFSCHEDEWRGYQQHGMAQSYYPLTQENRVETVGVEVTDAASGLIYRIVERDGKLYQEERRDDGHQLLREMQFVVGSGTAARTYLTENNGRLFELPLTWYTQTGRWDFSPGYAEANSRFARLVPDRCMACHNSLPESEPFAEGKYRTVPHGIGCERCHGPGERHVDARLANPEPSDSIDWTIVNPRHLSLERRLDVCQQCHLHGTVSLLRDGQEPFGFRPSQPLDGFLALFSEASEDEERIGVISHADRMKQSACFIATQGTLGAMDCVTCHNPHEGFREAGATYFNNTCISCHALDALQGQFATEEARAQHQATSNCFDCHMPKVEADDAPHASFTDHRIRVVEQTTAALPAPIAAHSVQLTPYFEHDRESEAGRIYEGMAYVVYGQQNDDTDALERGVQLLAEALQDSTTHGEGYYLRGLGLRRLGRETEALGPLEQAVRINPNIPERLNALAQAYEVAGRDPSRISRLYQRALGIQPALAEVRVNYGRFLEAQGQLEAAMDQYQQAAAEQPWLAVAHFNVGTAFLRQGQFEAAEEAMLEAIRLDPDYAEARGNLGLLYATQDEPEKAREQFEAAVQAEPQNPVALGNLGTYHLNANNLPAAIQLLSQAVTVDTGYVDGLVNLALAHFRSEQMGEARRYAEAALRIQPNHPMAQQILRAL